MREVKFRAWDGFHNRMINPVAIYGRKNGEVSIMLPHGQMAVDFALGSHWKTDDYRNRYTSTSLVTPMQYTGLKDKNGVEIYEGDLLANDSDAPLTVYWDEVWGCFSSKDTEDGTEFGLLGNAEPESYGVIGNIYENPELLK